MKQTQQRLRVIYVQKTDAERLVEVNDIIHWETIPSGCTMTADLYCQHLDQIAEKLKEKQDRIYYLHDKARAHVAKLTREKFLKLG